MNLSEERERVKDGSNVIDEDIERKRCYGTLSKTTALEMFLLEGRIDSVHAVVSSRRYHVSRERVFQID